MKSQHIFGNLKPTTRFISIPRDKCSRKLINCKESPYKTYEDEINIINDDLKEDGESKWTLSYWDT